MKFFAIGLILLGFGIAESEAIADPILNRLAHVPQFAFGGGRFAGAISQGQKDCKSVLARSTALADLEKLLSIGNPQAKAYALVGIRKFNPRRFTEVLQPFRSSKDEVIAERGCTVTTKRWGQ